MTTTMTRPISTTCAVCGEEFSTTWEAEQDNHECLPIHLRVVASDLSTANDAIDAAWTVPNFLPARGENRYPGDCYICLETVAERTGSLVRNGTDSRWVVRHASAAACHAARDLRNQRQDRATGPTVDTRMYSDLTSPAPFVVEVGQFHVLDGRYYRVRPIRRGSRSTTATRTQVARIVENNGRVNVTWVGAARSDRQRFSEVSRMTNAQAADFGMLTSQCVRCSLPLTDARSVAAGYGHVCARAMGWTYPTMEEAARTIAARQSSDDAAPISNPITAPMASIGITADGLCDCSDCRASRARSSARAAERARF